MNPDNKTAFEELPAAAGPGSGQEAAPYLRPDPAGWTPASIAALRTVGNAGPSLVCGGDCGSGMSEAGYFELGAQFGKLLFRRTIAHLAIIEFAQV